MKEVEVCRRDNAGSAHTTIRIQNNTGAVPTFLRPLLMSVHSVGIICSGLNPIFLAVKSQIDYTTFPIGQR